MTNQIKKQIREFIETSFLFREGRETLADDQSLLGEGLIDSTGILELVSYLETGLGVVVEDHEIGVDQTVRDLTGSPLSLFLFE